MITADGWFDWAIRRLGPDEKSGYPGKRSSIAEGVVYHSAEGNEAQLLAVLDGPREASWTASNLKDGRFLQHYPVERIVWTNGSKNANIKFRGVESEGAAGEALTQPQIDNLIRCAKDMAEYFGWDSFTRNVEAWEHREMTIFGATPTACPSGRIPWQTIQEGFMALNDSDYAKFKEMFAKAAREVGIQAAQPDANGDLKPVTGAYPLTRFLGDDWAHRGDAAKHSGAGAHTHPHTHPEAG